MNKRRFRPSPSMVVALVALFVALTGAAYAVTIAPKNSVVSTSIKNGQVKADDIASNAVNGSKVAGGSLGGAQIDESSLDFSLLQSRITGTCPSGHSVNSIAQNGGVGCTADNSLTGSSIDESTLGQVPSALNADTVGGKSASQLASGRIHQVGATAQYQPLVPGLFYATHCNPTKGVVDFLTNSLTGTSNAMSVARGIETPTSAAETVNLSDGAQISGFPYSAGSMSVAMDNDTADAAAETQLIIDVDAKTYSIALHMYLRASDGYCEAYGTATLAE
jgi:hypothetical protein